MTKQLTKEEKVLMISKSLAFAKENPELGVTIDTSKLFPSILSEGLYSTEGVSKTDSKILESLNAIITRISFSAINAFFRDDYPTKFVVEDVKKDVLHILNQEFSQVTFVDLEEPELEVPEFEDTGFEVPEFEEPFTILKFPSDFLNDIKEKTKEKIETTSIEDSLNNFFGNLPKIKEAVKQNVESFFDKEFGKEFGTEDSYEGTISEDELLTLMDYAPIIEFGLSQPGVIADDLFLLIVESLKYDTKKENIRKRSFFNPSANKSLTLTEYYSNYLLMEFEETGDKILTINNKNFDGIIGQSSDGLKTYVIQAI